MRSRAANYTYNYSARCAHAYQLYMSLHLDEGTAEIKQELMHDPYNLMATYLADYDDCLLLLFNGDQHDYEQRHSHMDARLQLLERGDESSPWYRLCRAGIYMHWAFVYIRMGENFKAATSFRKSFSLLKENQKRFPNFEYNNIFWGVEVAAVGAIPDDYKWIASIFGLHGDVKKGMHYLQNFLDTHNQQDILYSEAAIYTCYLRFYLLTQHDEVWNYLNSSKFPTQNNLLNQFVKTNIAVNHRKADAALACLHEVQSEPQYNRFPVFDFEMGNALLLKLNLNCISYFKRFLSRYNGKLFVKDTWQKLALAYYLQGNMHDAMACREKIKTQGTTDVDADRQALRFAKNTDWPDLRLLQARLLIDGGYYKSALERIGSLKENDFKDVPDKLEYLFRLGRIYDELGNDSRAMQYYQSTISLGKERPEYFAARAALQMGFIYEHAGKARDAIRCFNEALEMPRHDYQNSIDQQAKAGVNRLTIK